MNLRVRKILRTSWVTIYLSIYLSIYLWLYSPCGPWPLFSFLIYTHSVGLLGRGDQPVARLLPTHRTTQAQNKRTQTTLSQVGFESTISVFEWAKTSLLAGQMSGSHESLCSMESVTVEPQRFYFPWSRLRLKQQPPTRAEECNTVSDLRFKSKRRSVRLQPGTLRQRNNARK
jgi:hypothetical protein